MDNNHVCLEEDVTEDSKSEGRHRLESDTQDSQPNQNAKELSKTGDPITLYLDWL